jgi:hypothetical protein
MYKTITYGAKNRFKKSGNVEIHSYKIILSEAISRPTRNCQRQKVRKKGRKRDGKSERRK